MSTTLHQSQPPVATVLAQFQAFSPHKIRQYVVNSQKFLDKSSLLVSVSRQELQKQWTNDYDTYTKLVAQNPNKKNQWYLNRGWLNVPVTIKATFIFGLQLLELTKNLSDATSFVVPLGLFNPYGLLLDAQNQPLAICLNPRVHLTPIGSTSRTPKYYPKPNHELN